MSNRYLHWLNDSDHFGKTPAMRCRECSDNLFGSHCVGDELTISCTALALRTDNRRSEFREFARTHWASVLHV